MFAGHYLIYFISLQIDLFIFNVSQILQQMYTIIPYDQII